jgi:hypothetical protein
MGIRKFDPETAQAARALQLRPCEDDSEVAHLARVRGIHDRLSRFDQQILARCKFQPVDIDKLEIDVHGALWLVAQKMLDVWVDPADRVWVRTSILGSTVADLDGVKQDAAKLGRPKKTAAAGCSRLRACVKSRL